MSMSSRPERLYLDHAATSPMRKEVWRAMEAELDHCYNPASAHAFGRQAHRCLELSRGRIAELLGCQRTEIYFTAGGTVSDNIALLGFVRAHADHDPRVFTSAIEHKANLTAGARAEAEGARFEKIPVDAHGVVDVAHLERRLADDPSAPTLVSVMWANNEIGTVQPVAEIAELAHAHGARFHTDAVQAIGKVPVSLEDVPVDHLSATAHKLGGPVGIGLLFSRKGTDLEPLTYGGGQERAMWPGTQNPVAACGFAKALELAIEERASEAPRWRELRDHLCRRLKAEIPGARIHGEGAPERLPHLVSLGIPDCDGGAVLVSLDLDGIAASGGSACSSGASQGSFVLDAIGVDPGDRYATVRLSFGHETTRADVDRVADTLARIAERVSRLPATV